MEKEKTVDELAEELGLWWLDYVLFALLFGPFFLVWWLECTL